MPSPRIVERLEDFIILINRYPYYSREIYDKKKGIVRIWGRDNDIKKINYVIYPKKYYNREYIEKNILPKYDVCPKCQIGENIISNPTRINEIKSRIKNKQYGTKKYSNIVLGTAFLFVPIGIALGVYHQYKNQTNESIQ